MKVLRFIFKDFWRKLIALIFALVLYWEEDGFKKKQEEMQTEKTFAVQVLDLGSGQQIVFSDGSEPEVSATIIGKIDDLKDGDLRFYIEADGDLTPGPHKLKVYYHIRRSDIKVRKFKPVELEVSVIENPENNH